MKEDVMIELTTDRKYKVIPCPFCKSTHIMHFGTNGDSLYCRSCNAEGPGAISGELKEAVDNWNKAVAALTELRDKMKNCSNCKHQEWSYPDPLCYEESYCLVDIKEKCKTYSEKAEKDYWEMDE